MGGEAKIRAIESVHLEILGHRNLLEQSERPEGPYVADYRHVEEWRDFGRRRWKQTIESNVVIEDKFVNSAWVVDDVAARKVQDHVVPGNGEQVAEAEEALAFSPERVLITALAAADLKRLPNLMLQAVPHELIAFTYHRIPVKVYLNSETHLPTAVEWTRAYPFHAYWNVWGDVNTRVYYSFWWLSPGGIHYPLQADVLRNGLPDHAYSSNKVEFGVPIAESEFTIPAEVRDAFQKRSNVKLDDRPLGMSDQPAQELAKDILFIPGPWNVSLVKQEDGVIVIESPISAGYSRQVIEEAGRRWPGVRIKAVISTSDSWPHIGGIREYVARGIPIYVLDRTEPLIRRVIASPHHEEPDSLATSPKELRLHVVSGKVVVGSGANRIEIYPLRGETSERQMMVYFPVHKLLYGSDPFQKSGDNYHLPQTVSELVDAVHRERLDVDRFYMMHVDPTPWKTLEESLASRK